MTTITTERSYIADVWVGGFIAALEAAGIPEDRHARLLADTMPEDVRSELARKEARRERDAYVRRMVDSGQLVRLTDGRLIEADRYDPQFHGPKDELDD